jgi:hypothetical protein
MTPLTLISLKNVVTPVTVAPPPTTLRPDLEVTRPMESTLVTSSYVNTPLKVAATPVILLTVISGEPESPAAVPELFTAIVPDPLMVLPLGRVAP